MCCDIQHLVFELVSNVTTLHYELLVEKKLIWWDTLLFVSMVFSINVDYSLRGNRAIIQTHIASKLFYRLLAHSALLD